MGKPHRRGRAKTKRTKAGRQASGKRASRARARARPRAARPPKAGAARADLRAVGGTMHDLTNVATAMRAYLELLETQGALDPRQKYYLDRAKDQVDTLVTTVRDLRGRLPQG